MNLIRKFQVFLNFFVVFQGISWNTLRLPFSNNNNILTTQKRTIWKIKECVEWKMQEATVLKNQQLKRLDKKQGKKEKNTPPNFT